MPAQNRNYMGPANHGIVQCGRWGAHSCGGRQGLAAGPYGLPAALARDGIHHVLFLLVDKLYTLRRSALQRPQGK